LKISIEIILPNSFCVLALQELSKVYIRGIESKIKKTLEVFSNQTWKTFENLLNLSQGEMFLGL